MAKILFVSLGCDKNLVDSEQMIGLLSENGHEFIDDEYEAEVIVVNSCCFIGDAKEESINTIIEMGSLKETAQLKALIVTGCLAQRYPDEIRQELPEVDAILGTTAFDEIIECVNSVLAGERKYITKDINKLTYLTGHRTVTTGGHYAYLKIADGCSKRCTYCIIPKIRGDYRSVPMDDLVADAVSLAQKGVKELILVAQETTVYGTDLYGKKMLPILLKKLAEIDGIRWIRILYCYPEEITDELIETIKNESKICNYLDLPIQSASNRILKKMGRYTTREDLVEIIGKLRSEIPDITLRTTLITGFPGETIEDHKETLEFVEQMKFDRLGVFTYSPEENTVAYNMPEQLDEDIKLDRQAEIMELQQSLAFEKAESLKGSTMLAFVEGKVSDENVYVARSYRDAPSVDGLLFINSEEELMTGDFARVEITGAYEYDLIGELI